MDFVREIVAAGMVDPASISYTSTDLYQQWQSGKVGMGIINSTLTYETGMNPVTGPLKVMTPIKGPHGDRGTLEYLKNFMMYTNTPSTLASEAFMVWWLQQFVGPTGFFARGVTGSVPARKSVLRLPNILSNPQMVKIVKDWVPIAKSYSARSKTLFAGLASVDAGRR